MEDIKELVKTTLGPLPTVCQEHVMLDMERARMQAEDNKAALVRTHKKMKRLEDQREEALQPLGAVRDDLLHVYERSGVNEHQEFAVSVSINALTNIIYGMESDSDA
jgi:hypothetical protein